MAYNTVNKENKRNINPGLPYNKQDAALITSVLPPTTATTAADESEALL